jgi:hypothetical protein
MMEDARMPIEDENGAAAYAALKAHAAAAAASIEELSGFEPAPAPGNVSFFPALSQPGDTGPVRDFKSAIDLIKEASGFSEERSVELEQQLHQITSRSAEQVKALELQVAALERRLVKSEERARAAEVRANDAETWLSRLHDTIITSFRRPSLPTDGDSL